MSTGSAKHVSMVTSCFLFVPNSHQIAELGDFRTFSVAAYIPIFIYYNCRV